MRFGYSETCLEHDPGDRHPEQPDRLLAIRKGLLRRHNVEFTSADPATRPDVEAVHDPAYLDDLERFCENGGGQWDPDTVAVPATWEAAFMSAGLAMWAAREALQGATGRETAFSLGRPPGHHAVVDDAMGFCFINNAAVAARHAITDHGATRVAIIDWDVHHGNGTQDIFYADGDVFYASIHEEGLYPGTGKLDETGEGDGQGTTLNMPLPAGAGDAAYRDVVEDLLAPAVDGFDADLVLVSAGFDPHEHDPISRMRLSTEGFGLLADRVRALADRASAGLGFVLEGGYGLDTLSDGIGMVHETFDGREPVESVDAPAEDVTRRIERAREIHGLD